MSSLVRRIIRSASRERQYMGRGSKLGVHWEVASRQKVPRGRRRGKHTAKWLAAREKTDGDA